MRIGRVGRVNVGASYPGTRLSAPSGYGTIAAGLSDISRTVSDIASQQQKMEEQEARRLGSLEAADLEAQTEIAVQNYRDSLSTTVIDPAEYRKQLSEGVDTIAKDMFARAKNPHARDMLAKKIPGLLAGYNGQAIKHAQDLRTQHVGASLTRTLDNIEFLTGNVAIGDDESFAKLAGQAVAAIGAAAPFIGGQDVADKLWIAKRERMVAERAERHVREDPAGFLASVDSKYRGLDPMKRNTYVKTAEDRITAAVKADNVEKERYFDALEKEAEDERASLLTDLRTQGLKGGLTVAALDVAKAARVITTPAEYEVLYKLATETKARVSDPDALLAASLRANRTVPTISEAELDRQYAVGLLSHKDWDQLKTRVISRTQDLRSEGLTEKKLRHQQAEQVLQAGIGIAGPQDKWDKQDLQLWGVAISDLTARSNVFDGKEDPIAAARDIANKIAPIRQERMRLTVEDISKTLQFPAPDAASAMKRLNEKRKELPPAVLAQEERKIADMTRAEGAMAVQGPAAASKTGSKLRPAGTKPQGGKADD